MVTRCCLFEATFGWRCVRCRSIIFSHVSFRLPWSVLEGRWLLRQYPVLLELSLPQLQFNHILSCIFQAAMISIGGTVIPQAISSATRALTAPVAGQSFSLPYLSGCHDQYWRDGDRSGNIQCYQSSHCPSCRSIIFSSLSFRLPWSVLEGRWSLRQYPVLLELSLPQLQVNHFLFLIFQAAMISIGGTVIAQAISSATGTLYCPSWWSIIFSPVSFRLPWSVLEGRWLLRQYPVLLELLLPQLFLK